MRSLFSIFDAVQNRTQDALADLQWWWPQEDNAILLSQFWLAEFDDDRRNDLVAMEGDLLREEISLAFQSAGAVLIMSL